MITPKLLKRLADDGLRGIKDSSFDLVSFYNFQDAVKEYPDFNVIVGTEAIFCGAFDAGARGCVYGLGNIYPELLEEMYEAYLAGNKDKAIELQRRVIQLRNITKLAPSVPVMHAILQMRGVDAGISRSPYIEIGEDLKIKVKDALIAQGLL